MYADQANQYLREFLIKNKINAISNGVQLVIVKDGFLYITHPLEYDTVEDKLSAALAPGARFKAMT